MQTRNDAYISALQFGPSVNIQPQFNTAVIEAFSYDNASVVSTILAEYPLENTDAISIRLPISDAAVDADSFALCARYTENSVTVRYVLTKPTWFGNILFPQYTGQKLGPSAVVEVWSLDDTTPAVCDEDIELTVGPLVFQTAGQIAVCGQIQADTTTLTPTVI